MAIANCLICKASFYVKPSHLQKGWGKYCSIICRSRSQLKGSTFKCHICSKEIYRSPLAIKKSKSRIYFCSKKCQTMWRNKILFTGKNHSNWKNGESAYRRILESTGTKKKCVLCKTFDKRVLIVHHIDFNRKNNELTNLAWLCYNCHYLVHNFADSKSKFANIISEMVVVVQK